MGKFFKVFNCPGRFFEVLGYFTVVIGIIIFAIGVFRAITDFSPCGVTGAPDSVVLNTGAGGGSLIIMGIITAIVAPQLFFAISKVVKAAEKYLGE